MGKKKEGVVEKDRGQAARAKPDDTPGIQRAAVPPTTEEAVIYAGSCETVSVMDVAKGLESALERFRCGLSQIDDDQEAATAVCEEVLRYLEQLFYVLQSLAKYAYAALTPEQVTEILKHTQAVDEDWHVKFGYRRLWSIDGFTEAAVWRLLDTLRAKKADLVDVLRTWQKRRFPKAVRSSFGGWEAATKKVDEVIARIKAEKNGKAGRKG